MSYTTYLRERQEQSLEELKELLRIASVSTLDEHNDDVAQAAEWVANRLRMAGVEHVAIMPTGDHPGDHPVVYGDWCHSPGKATVLVYGHFDVQPADPIDEWKTDPFEPTEANGRIYARGADDMKANLVAAIVGIESVLKNGSLDVNVKFLFEGEEEIGSRNLSAFVEKHQEKLACDVVFSADGTQWSEDQPALLMGLRGVCALQIDVQGPDHDLHSGLYGGAVANPAHALAGILASMRRADGSIAIEGFLDDVADVTSDDRETLGRVPFDAAEFMRTAGVNELSGEPGYSTLERVWMRPTLEVNGMWSGFLGGGVKTIIPAQAHAKITCRLVPNQEPARIVSAITNHIERQDYPGVTVTVTPFKTEAGPYRIPTDHWANQAAKRVLTQVYEREPCVAMSGGSIPVAELSRSILGADMVCFAFGLEDQRCHSPNEFMRLRNFERGQEAWAMLFEQLSS